MFPIRRLAFLALLAVVASPSHALEKGSGVYGIQLGSSTADLYFGSGPYVSAFSHSENTAGFQYWRMMSDDYATTLSVGVGWFSEVDQANDASPDIEYTQSSWHVRLGGDRVVSLSDRATLYVGPGLEYWSGGYESVGSGPDFESEKVSRISLTGRVGAIMMLSSSIGINCHANARLGRAQVEDGGAEATWWPSGVDGSIGLVFATGGK